MMDAPLWNLTSEDLIREYRGSGSEIVRELADRLASAIDAETEDIAALASREDDLEKLHEEKEMMTEELAELAARVQALEDEMRRFSSGAPVAPPPTPIEVRTALIGVKHTHGRDAAVGIMARFSGGSHKFDALPENEYAAVLAACAALNKKGAA